MFIAAGCTVFGDPSWTRVGEIGGQLVALDLGSEDGSFQHLVSEDDGVTWVTADFAGEPSEDFELADKRSICLESAPEICVRSTTDAIEESSDGGATYETVWQLDLSGDWLSRSAGTRFTARIETSTVFETETGAVLVGVGALSPIRRSPNGVWSPDEAALRTFPWGSVIAALVAIAGLAVSLAARPVAIGGATLSAALLLFLALIPSLGTWAALAFAIMFVLGIAALVIVKRVSIEVRQPHPPLLGPPSFELPPPLPRPDPQLVTAAGLTDSGSGHFLGSRFVESEVGDRLLAHLDLADLAGHRHREV